MTTGVANLQSGPFPGLRPFAEGEEACFFGREEQVDTMVDKLAVTRFLAVVGTSGSGKSSLVNCGLLPALYRGLMVGAGSAWRVAVFRPGNRPIRALAEALARPAVLTLSEADASGFSPADLTEATLRMSKLGLVDAFEQAHLDPRQNLLVVVDQFEELFRYHTLATTPGAGRVAPASEDATAFVNLLLETRAHPELRVYVVLTMRSDFLGECSQFFGLPEAINGGQYLVPRMTRDERRSAIAGPVAVGGAEIDPVLLTRLVNDVGDNPDQLSILQHALNRTWANWQKDGGRGPLTLTHYDAVGTMAHALDHHAEEAFGELTEGRQRTLAEALFKAITDKTTDARGTRRPTRMDTLLEITGATAAELTTVIDVFRNRSRSFLMPPEGTALTLDRPIDISHESLMRVWERLRRWVDEEAQSAQVYRRLAETADLNASGQAGLLRQPDLQFALGWLRRQQPNAAWALRYRTGFEQTLGFLHTSEEAFDQEVRAQTLERARQARARRIKLVVVPAILVLLIFVAAVIYLNRQAAIARLQAEAQAYLKEQAEGEAQIQAVEAERARLAAESALATVRRQEEEAKVIADVTQSSPAARERLERAVESKTLVYLQFADPAQRATAERLRAQLEKVSYSAPGVEQVGAVPSRTEIRYFRKADLDDASKLAALLKQWNWGEIPVRFVDGKVAQSLRQFEIWFARQDEAEINRLLQQMNGATPEVRRPAGQIMQDRYTSSSAAIAGALALFTPERVASLSSSGRINSLYFLTRTAPLAWDADLEAKGRLLVEQVRRLPGVGADTEAELQRLARLLDAVKAGAAAPPSADRTP